MTWVLVPCPVSCWNHLSWCPVSCPSLMSCLVPWPDILSFPSIWWCTNPVLILFRSCPILIQSWYSSVLIHKLLSCYSGIFLSCILPVVICAGNDRNGIGIICWYFKSWFQLLKTITITTQKPVQSRGVLTKADVIVLQTWFKKNYIANI